MIRSQSVMAFNEQFQLKPRISYIWKPSELVICDLSKSYIVLCNFPEVFLICHGLAIRGKLLDT